MLDTISPIQDMLPLEVGDLIDTNEHDRLMIDLETLLATAQPRLARLARKQGVTPEAVDDVVQETLVEAWCHLKHLRTPDRFDAWLNGICHNVCLRWSRSHYTSLQRQLTFSRLHSEQDDNEELAELDIADPQAIDLDEELSRQDLVLLLDRAMSYLPDNTRAAVEMHYLAELPQREAALRLGVTINALEVKLHRARRQLKQILSNQLRTDAVSLGLAVDNETTGQWRETGMWCFFCARHRLVGLFESMPDGKVNLRLRCPVCSPTHDSDIVNTAGMAQLDNVRSFRPAIKRALHTVSPIYAQGLASGTITCLSCKAMAQMRGVEPHSFPAPFYQRYCYMLDCPNCGVFSASLIISCFSLLPAQKFMEQHPRFIIEPEEPIEYEGRLALRGQITDVTSASRFITLVHRETLEVLATFTE